MNQVAIKNTKQLHAEQVAEQTVERFAEIINRNNVHYVSEPNKYAVQNSQGVWTYIAVDAFYKQHLIHTADDKRTFDLVLSHMQRMKRKAESSFREQPDDVLNVLDRSRWLQPAPGPVDPIFDVLLDSLSGGRQNVRDHIEQVFVYKYLHPECYTLPCITISGEGGAGKNEFVDKVMKTVFGAHQVESLGTAEAFGQFNGRMLGKTVIYIDEALVDRTDANAMKRKVGNMTMDVNVKYGMQGSFDNTPWYWLGGNGTNGAVMLAGDTTDRRYSILTVSKNIMHWVGKHIGVDTGTGSKTLPGSHPCVQWFNEHKDKLSDPIHVARWLDSVVERWRDQKHVPSALHDEDYSKVRKAQKSVMEDVMESVFLDPDFTYISGATLYEVFKAQTAIDSPATRAVKNMTTFIQDAKKWLDDRELPIAYDTRKVVRGVSMDRSGEPEKTTLRMFYNTTKGVKTQVKSNDIKYIHTDERGHKTLVERGLAHLDVAADEFEL